MDRVDCVVIGAGVVGLAIARAQARAGREVLILESEPIIGSGTSSRNSEVIHAGIYYPQGSLKARFCVAGKQALYALCESHGIPHRRCGKLIVATAPEQVDGLLDIRRHAEANGVDDLRLLDAGELADLEPNLHAVAALLSPSTGIIDSHAYMLALQGDAEAAGAALAVQAPVIGGAIRDDGILLRIGGAEPMELLAERVINSAGLSAQRVAASLEGFAAEHVPPTYYAKGNYFNLAARSPFSRLVYPMPEPGGLGTHLTLDLGGQARFGPDVQWVEAPDYHVDPSRGDAFYAAIRRYWPALPDEALVPAYCGIRPKISGPGEAAADFRIDGPQVHGVAGLVNLFGIESPGLTSALAIGDYVTELLRRV